MTEEQRAFQRREWPVQRIGTIVLLVFVLAGLAGVLGPGPLSSTTRSSGNGLFSVDIDRVARFNTDDAITVTFAPEAEQGGTITLEFTGTWIRGVEVQGITPEPAEQRALPDGIALTFLADPSGQTEATLSFRAQQHLVLQGQARVRGETVAFTQFVLP